MRLLTAALLAVCGVLDPSLANDSVETTTTPAGTEPLLEDDFAALKESSPFLRSLNLSETLILTGIARVEGDLYATLLDRETRRTHVLSGATNSEGWRLVEVRGNKSDLGTVTARISASGEVFSVRFDEVTPEKRIAQNRPRGPSGSGPGSRSDEPVRDYREGVSGDGYRGAPPPDLVEKMSRLNEETRNRLIQEIREIRDRGDVSSEDRQVLFRRMVDRALQQGR